MAETQTADREEGLKTLAKLVAKNTLCMLITTGPGGDLNSRPMAVNNQEPFDGTLWFFTYEQSFKVKDVQRTQNVNVAFSDPGHQEYISMAGRAALVRDRAEIEKRWTPTLKAWFPKGMDEPGIALIRVDVQHAEWWDAPSSAVAHALSLAKGILTGKPAQPGENKAVDLT